MDDLDSVEIPRGIDDPHIVLLWTYDELGMLAFFFIIGFLTGYLMLSLVAGILAIKQYRKFKDGKQDGVLLHLAYWLGFIKSSGYSFKNPFIRRFFP